MYIYSEWIIFEESILEPKIKITIQKYIYI